jgi:hypothetical protein
MRSPSGHRPGFRWREPLSLRDPRRRRLRAGRAFGPPAGSFGARAGLLATAAPADAPLVLLVPALLAAGTGAGFAALAGATSWPVALALPALPPIAGWRLLRPLAGEELRRLGGGGAAV